MIGPPRSHDCFLPQRSLHTGMGILLNNIEGGGVQAGSLLVFIHYNIIIGSNRLNYTASNITIML